MTIPFSIDSYVDAFEKAIPEITSKGIKFDFTIVGPMFAHSSLPHPATHSLLALTAVNSFTAHHLIITATDETKPECPVFIYHFLLQHEGLQQPRLEVRQTAQKLLPLRDSWEVVDRSSIEVIYKHLARVYGEAEIHLSFFSVLPPNILPDAALARNLLVETVFPAMQAEVQQRTNPAARQWTVREYFPHGVKVHIDTRFAPTFTVTRKPLRQDVTITVTNGDLTKAATNIGELRGYVDLVWAARPGLYPEPKWMFNFVITQIKTYEGMAPHDMGSVLFILAQAYHMLDKEYCIAVLMARYGRDVIPLLQKEYPQSISHEDVDVPSFLKSVTDDDVMLTLDIEDGALASETLAFLVPEQTQKYIIAAAYNVMGGDRVDYWDDLLRGMNRIAVEFERIPTGTWYHEVHLGDVRELDYLAFAAQPHTIQNWPVRSWSDLTMEAQHPKYPNQGESRAVGAAKKEDMLQHVFSGVTIDSFASRMLLSRQFMEFLHYGFRDACNITVTYSADFPAVRRSFMRWDMLAKR